MRFALGNIFLHSESKTQTMKLTKFTLWALRGLDSEQKESLAKDMGVSKDTLNRWLRDESNKLTMYTHLESISTLLQMDIEQLVDKQQTAA